MSVLFTSDLHFGHTNILRFDNRPWSSIEAMDHDLIERWNMKAKPGDIVYVLGDMFWKSDPNYVGSILDRLNGQVYLIKGNHDRWLNSANLKKLAGVKDYLELKVKLKDGTERKCVCSHYFTPFYNSHYHNGIMLHGHSHLTKEHEEELFIAKELNKKGFNNTIINVGCMLNDYEPKTLDELLEKYNDQV